MAQSRRRSIARPLAQTEAFNQGDAGSSLHLDLQQPSIVVAYHPVTIARDTTQEADAVFAALAEFRANPVLLSQRGCRKPHSHRPQKKFVSSRQQRGAVFVNLDAVTYWSLLKQVDLMLGNSSSGIMETASLALPTVNIGLRQKGRERARNVLDADATVESILKMVAIARSANFRQSVVGVVNPYGDGHASEKIVSVLTSIPWVKNS